MRAIQTSWLVGSMLLLVASPCVAQNDIPWIADPYQARQLAVQQQRLLLLHFYTDWCPPCRKLERDVFPRPDVIKTINANFVAAKINADRFKEVAQQLKVEAFPTDVILDPNGQEVFRGVTPQDPIRYSTQLSNVAASSRGGGPALANGPRLPLPEQAGLPSPPNTLAARSNPYQIAYSNPTNTLAASGPGYRDAVPYGNPQTNAAARTWQSDPSPPPPFNMGSGGQPQYVGPYGDQGSRNEGSNRSAGMGAPPPVGSNYEPRTQLNPYVVSAWQGPGGAGAMPAAPPGPRSDGPPSSVYGENRYPLGPDREAAAKPPANDAARGGGLPTKNMVLRETGERREAPAAYQDAPQAMDGYCPVTLTDEERWQKGSPQWGAIHRGQTYLFASLQQQQRFLADPDRYSPVLVGYDPVRYIDRGEIVPGKRQYGMWYRGKIYLFLDEASLDQFSAKPELYSQKTQESMLNSGR